VDVGSRDDGFVDLQAAIVLLTSFRVRVFRNIIDSAEVTVDEVTSLMGRAKPANPPCYKPSTP
jgi:hypothetical protein